MDNQSELIGLVIHPKTSEDNIMKFQFRILCVDDEETCEMLNATFKSSDIEIISANTVAEGWRLAQSKKFDLYLLATRFHDGDGFDLCRRIHNLAPHKPIVFYTGDARSADQEKGMAAGATEYLVKPYFGNLEETILKHIEGSKKSAPMISKISEPTVNYLKTVSF